MKTKLASLGSLLIVTFLFGLLVSTVEAQNRKASNISAQTITPDRIEKLKFIPGIKIIDEPPLCGEGMQCDIISYWQYLEAKDVSDGTGARCKYSLMEREFRRCTYWNKDCTTWKWEGETFGIEISSWIVNGACDFIGESDPF